MIDEHGGYQPDPIHDEDYGSGDPVLPYTIGGAVVALALIAMHTVGHKTVAFGTTLAFIADVAWLVAGVIIVLVLPIYIWIPMERKHKWGWMFLSIFLGIMYFVVSGVLMAYLPRMN